MQTVDTPTSRVVFLRRKAISVHEAQPDLKDYFDNSHRALASYWQKGSMRPGTGLTIAEENFLMPYILNIPETDRDFRTQVTDWFHAIETRVDPIDAFGNGGTAWEIGLENNEEPVSPKNLPLNVVHFVKWRHALGHPEVGLSFEDVRGNQLKRYYIHDPKAVTKSSLSVADIRDKALEAYLQVKQSIAKTIQYLSLMQVDPAKHRGTESVKLRELAETKPTTFLEVHNDRDKDFQYMLMDLVQAKVLEEIGTRIIFKQSGDQMGKDLKEAIAWMKAPENSKQVAIFKAQIQDYKKKENLYVAVEEPVEAKEEIPTPAPTPVQSPTPAATPTPQAPAGQITLNKTGDTPTV